MLTTARLVSPVRLTSDDARRVVAGLARSGWSPAVYEAEREFKRLAGLKATTSILRHSNPFAGDVDGDVFFRDDDIYYFVAHSPGDVQSRMVVFGGSDDPPPVGLEVGLIGHVRPEVAARLDEFARAVEVAVPQALKGGDGTNSMQWTRPIDRSGRLTKLGDATEGGAVFSPAVLSAQSRAGAELLATAPVRDVLRDISKAGFARGGDLRGRWKQRNRSEDAENALTKLKEANLIVVEHLLECRQTGAPIMQLPDASRLADPAVADLIHPPCGKRLADEVLTEGFGVSALGRELNQRSHWMTVWVTERLLQLGVAEDSILWNVTASGEEIDIVFEFFDELWIVELKDRDFGPGDAYPFNYRYRAQYAAQRAVIITTERVGEDARKVLDDLAGEAERTSSVTLLAAARARTSEPRPIIVEGLDNVEEVLRRELSSAATRFATRRVEALGAATGFDLERVIALRFTQERGRRFQRTDPPKTGEPVPTASGGSTEA